MNPSLQSQARHGARKQDQGPGLSLPPDKAWTCSLVVVRDAVGPVGLVHDEGGALQGAGTDHAGEAVRVVGFARGSQHAFRDGLPTGVALFQGVLRRQRQQVGRELDPKGQLLRFTTPSQLGAPPRLLTV